MKKITSFVKEYVYFIVRVVTKANLRRWSARGLCADWDKMHAFRHSFRQRQIDRQTGRAGRQAGRQAAGRTDVNSSAGSSALGSSAHRLIGSSAHRLIGRSSRAARQACVRSSGRPGCLCGSEKSSGYCIPPPTSPRLGLPMYTTRGESNCVKQVRPL
jgi:hypothetical protein